MATTDSMERSSTNSAAKSPREFAVEHGINVQNVYYWMKKYGYGRKVEGRWSLDDEEQQKMLNHEAARPDRKQYANARRSRKARKRAPESKDSVSAELGVDSETATLIRLLLDHRVNERLLAAVAPADGNSGAANSGFTHDRILRAVGRLIGSDRLGVLCIRDGYPLYKYPEADSLDSYTVTYSVSDQIYYIDKPEQLVRQHGELVVRPYDDAGATGDPDVAPTH